MGACCGFAQTGPTASSRARRRPRNYSTIVGGDLAARHGFCSMAFGKRPSTVKACSMWVQASARLPGKWRRMGRRGRSSSRASAAYLAAASEEAALRHSHLPIHFVHGDFVAVAYTLPTAAIVTLDRVVCCYPSSEPLLRCALRHAERGIAYSYPRDRWYVRAVMLLENLGHSRRTSFRTYVHPVDQMTQLIEPPVSN